MSVGKGWDTVYIRGFCAMGYHAFGEIVLLPIVRQLARIRDLQS